MLPSILLATHFKPNIEIWRFLLFFSPLLAIKKLPNLVHFQFFDFKKSYKRRNFANKTKLIWELVNNNK
jgi:hypothetical protein